MAKAEYKKKKETKEHNVCVCAFWVDIFWSSVRALGGRGKNSVGPGSQGFTQSSSAHACMHTHSHSSRMQSHILYARAHAHIHTHLFRYPCLGFSASNYGHSQGLFCLCMFTSQLSSLSLPLLSLSLPSSLPLCHECFATGKKKFNSNRQTGRQRWHVLCIVEKARFEPRTLGTRAECAANCATRAVAV